MLKIKDDVDLKELEKFGFTYCEEDVTQPEDKEPYINKYYSSYEKYHKMHNSGYDYQLYIDINTRIIDDQYCEPHFATIVPCDLIFDLIQAGLVEKI